MANKKDEAPPYAIEAGTNPRITYGGGQNQPIPPMTQMAAPVSMRMEPMREQARKPMSYADYIGMHTGYTGAGGGRGMMTDPLLMRAAENASGVGGVQPPYIPPRGAEYVANDGNGPYNPAYTDLYYQPTSQDPVLMLLRLLAQQHQSARPPVYGNPAPGVDNRPPGREGVGNVRTNMTDPLVMRRRPGDVADY